MIKKLATLLISALLTLSAMPIVSANAADSEADYKVLAGLGIIDSNLPKSITNDVFFKSLAGFFYDDVKGMSGENCARGLGAIDSAAQFKANSKLTVKEALKYSAIALGYNKVTSQPTDDLLVSQAVQLGLAKGVTGSYEDTLTSENMITIFASLLEAEPIKMNLVSSNPSYSVAKDETLLSMHRDIFHYRGYVTATENTSMYSEKGVSKGKIRLDDTEFYAKAYDSSLIGKYVEAYIKSDEDETVIYVGEIAARNETLIIDAEDVEDVSDDLAQIEYYTESEQLKRAKIDQKPSFIYNGVYFGSYSKADFMPDQGKIELIDNDNDGTYEVVKVTAYQTIIVNSVDIKNNVISNKYTHSGNLAILDIYEMMRDGRVEIIRDGESLAFSKISVNDVLNVAISKSASNPICSIYVSSQKLATGIMAIDRELGEIETEDNIYKMSAAFDKEMAHKNQVLEIGKRYNFYLDSFGEIAYVEVLMENDYCVYRKISTDDNGDIVIQYMTMDGEWTTSKLARKIRLDGVSMSDVVAYENHLKYYSPQIIQINENSQGEINRITFAKETDKYEEGVFRKSTPKTLYYRAGRHFDNSLYLEDNALMVVFPSSADAKKEDYYITDPGALRNDSSYTVTAYDTDIYGFTSLIMVKGVEVSSNSSVSGMFLVTKIKRAMTADSEVKIKIEGCVDGLRNIDFFVEDDSYASEIEVGDVITFRTSIDGYISETPSRLFRLSEPLAYQTGSDRYNGAYYSGKIVDIDAQKGRFRMKCGDNKYVTFKYTPTMGLVVYDKGTKKGELNTASNLMVGDEIIVKIVRYGCDSIIKIAESR